MQRLYQAAKVLRAKEKKADVARLLGISDQLLNSWERRGISSRQIVDVAATAGCGLIWLRDGEGGMTDDAMAPASGNLQDVVDLITSYARLPQKDRELVLRFTRSLLLQK